MGPVDKLSSANDSAESTGYFARGGQIFVSFKDLSWKKPQPTIAAQGSHPHEGGRQSWLRPSVRVRIIRCRRVLRCNTPGQRDVARIRTFSYPAAARQSEKTDCVLTWMNSRKRRQRRHPIENGGRHSFTGTPDSAFLSDYRETPALS